MSPRGTVKTGLFGSKVSFVPLQAATGGANDLRVPYEKSQVKDAPKVEADSELSEEEERRLYEHYSMDFGGHDYARHSGDGQDTSGPNTDHAITRSEDEVRVGTMRVEAGHTRLRKDVVTEQVNTKVPLQARGGRHRARADHRGTSPERGAGTHPAAARSAAQVRPWEHPPIGVFTDSPLLAREPRCRRVPPRWGRCQPP